MTSNSLSTIRAGHNCSSALALLLPRSWSGCFWNRLLEGIEHRTITQKRLSSRGLQNVVSIQCELVRSRRYHVALRLVSAPAQRFLLMNPTDHQREDWDGIWSSYERGAAANPARLYR